jgi:hypothetical protein
MRLRLLLLGLLVVACHNNSPTDPLGVDQRGRLAGQVTIGPNCPVTTTAPCPTPPEAYAMRKVLVFDENKTKLLETVDITSFGSYSVALLPGRYTVDLKSVGIDKSTDVPAVVQIRQGITTGLNINIDTGLR